MRRLFITLLLFAAVTLGRALNGWKDGKEYTYKIKSCTLASFNRQAKEFSGIVMKGQFHVQASEPETLRARISQAQYSPIHMQLDVDWDSEIPCDHMDMKNLTLSDKPFEIKITRGVIKALIVDKNLSTWEINILKSIVGQLQLDIEGEKAKKPEHIQLSEVKQPYAWYKTMEDSVGGKCEVLYNISTLPAHMQEATSELITIPELHEDEDFIEIAKTKNYSNCAQKISHHYEFNGHNDWMPDSNEIGKYFSRSSVSRIVISGDAWKYTIRSSITLNKVLLNPNYKNEDYPGMIYSKIETSLLKVNDIQIRMRSPADAELNENLTYDYNHSFKKESPSQPRYAKSHKGDRKNRESWRDGDDFYEITSDFHSKEQYRDTHFEETMTELPDPNQLTPFSIGNYKYLITENKINFVRSAESIAREIGNETTQYGSMLEENILEKFTILSRLVCLMNVNEIDEVQQILYEPIRSGLLSQEQKVRRNTWAVFRDAVAQAGNEAALYSIRKWVKEKKIKENEAAKVIDSIAKTTRTPTPKYIDTFLEMLKLKEVNDQPLVYDHAHQSYADLLYHTVVNKRSSDTRYPVHAFGRFYGENIHNLHYKYFPYMAAELQDGFDKKDSIKIQALISAIGRTGHPRMVSLYEPYIEGKRNATSYERFLMVISMHRLANDYADIARSVLYNIYSNPDDYYEIRTAAVYLLMQTNPPAKILQRMANFTRYDTNKQVSSAVKSSIEWLATYQIGNQDFRDAATKAIPLLTPQIYGSQYSRGVFMKATNDDRNGMGLEAYYIGSDDSVIPKGVFVTIYLHKNEIKVPKIQMAAAVSQVQDLWDSLQKQLGIKDRDKGKAEQKRYSPENIAKIFGINGDKSELLEGFMSFTDTTSTRFASVSDQKTGHSEEQLNNLLIDLPQELGRLRKDLPRGIDFDDTSMINNEMVMSFPIETGYPLIFALKTSKISKVTGQCEGQIESYYDDQSPIPKSANITAKVHMIYGMNVQKRLSFITPFDDQEYISGIDKNVQIYLPIKVGVGYNKDKQEARLKFQPNNEKPQFKILQVTVEPFTSKHDIVSLKPVSGDINTRVIYKDVTVPLQVELNYNKQSLQFHWATMENQLISDKNGHFKNEMALQAIRKMVGAVASMYFDLRENTEYQAYSVRLSPCSDMGVDLKISYDVLIKDFMKSNKVPANHEHEMPQVKSPSLDKNMTEIERKQKLLTEAARNINSAKAYAIDVSFKINGDFQSSATFTAASARSNVDEKARTLLYVSAEIPKSENYFVSAVIESKSPNFRTMDYEETLKADSQHEIVAEMKYGKKDNEDKAETLKLNGKSKRTEKFKDQIRKSRQAQECMAKTRHTGNKLIPACMKANDRAFLMNVGDYDISFENESLLQAWAISYLGSRPRFVPHFRPRGHDIKEKNKITLSYEIFPDKRDYTVNITTFNGRITESTPIPPIFLYEWDEHTETNEERESLETAVAPYLTCALDRTQVRTFDNYRYDTHLGQCWHVAMTPFSKNDYFRPGHYKDIPEDKHVTIMISDNEDRHKELKITVGDKEVELSSRGPNRTIEATVDGEKIDLSKKYGWQEDKAGEIGLQIFELPDKSVKVISERYEVKITYDGFRAMIKVGDKYRASVRGLCGDNNGEPANDLKTPKGCLLEKPVEFTATYALINDEQCQGPARRIAEAAKQSKCTDDAAHPGNVISDNDAGRKHYDNSSISREETEHNTEDSNWIEHDSTEDARCLKGRTMVRKYSSEICFSMQPVSMCVSGCYPTGEKSKSIVFHCVLRSSTSEGVAESIEKGANLDFTDEKIAKKESHMIPIGCRASN